MTIISSSFKLVMIVLIVACAAPFQAIFRLFHLKLAHILPVLVHRAATRIMGIRIEIRGDPPRQQPTLVVSNHISWLDIVIISSVQPFSFIAKAEIEKWPIFGVLAKLQNSIFIDRQRRTATAKANHAIAERLRNGDAVVLFAEGTTGDGIRLEPFRSSLIGAAHTMFKQDPEIKNQISVDIKPLAISYTKRNGLPITKRDRPQIAWYGDMELAPHLWAFLKSGTLDVTLSWGEAIPLLSTTDRKSVTAAAEATVRKLLR